jgi:hypothetical protein
MSTLLNELIIGDHNAHEHQVAVIDGEHKAKGLIPRDFNAHPPGSYASAPRAVSFDLIPRSEWPRIIAEKAAAESRLSDIRLAGNNRQPIPSLNQGQVGYCWAHSSTHAVIILRALANMPYVPLSAYSVAATIKKGRDEGGWGAQSLDFITQRGIVSQALWPQGDRNYQKYAGQQAVWDNAAAHKVAEGWVDLDAAQYDRNLSFDQEGTLLLSDVPVVKDENWWGHSILGLDLVDGTSHRYATRTASGKLPDLAEFELMWGINDPVAAGFGVRIWNSWGDSWSDRGMGILTGSKAVSNGAVAPRVTSASTA